MLGSEKMTSFMIALCLLWASKYIIEKNSFRLLAIPTAVIGVPAHEFGHYIFCKLFGFRVDDVCWFRVPTPDNATYGYVAYSYAVTPMALIQKIVVSIGPLITGFLSIWLMSPYLDSILIDPISGNWRVSKVSEITWQNALILWIFCSITLHMLPSRTDIQGAIKGSILLGTIVYIVISLGLITSISLIERINSSLPQFTELLHTALTLLAPIVFMSLIGGIVSTIYNRVNK